MILVAITSIMTTTTLLLYPPVTSKVQCVSDTVFPSYLKVNFILWERAIKGGRANKLSHKFWVSPRIICKITFSVLSAKN